MQGQGGGEVEHGVGASGWWRGTSGAAIRVRWVGRCRCDAGVGAMGERPATSVTVTTRVKMFRLATGYCAQDTRWCGSARLRVRTGSWPLNQSSQRCWQRSLPVSKRGGDGGVSVNAPGLVKVKLMKRNTDL